MASVILTLLTLVSISMVSSQPISDIQLYVANQFQPVGAVMNHLVINQSMGYVYVAARNSLYQLDMSLNQVVANVTTGPVMDNINCMPDQLQQCSGTHPLHLTNNTNKLMLIDKSGSRLIVCGSIYQGICQTRSLTNISQVLWDMDSEFVSVVCNNEACSTVGVIAEGPTVNNNVLYVATTIPNHERRSIENPISTRSLNLNPDRENQLFRYAIEQGVEGSYIKFPDSYQQDYKYSFATGDQDGFVYFVSTLTMSTSHKTSSLIARICKSDIMYDSYVELPIACGEGNQRVLGARYEEDDDSNDGVLYLLFAKDNGSALCSFTKSHLDSIFYNTMEICYKQKGYNGTEEIVNLLELKSPNECQKADGGIYLFKPGASLTDPVVKTNKIELDYCPNYVVPIKQVLCGAFYLPSKMTRRVTSQATLVYEERGVQFTAVTTNSNHNYTKVAFIGTKQGTILQVNINKSLKYSTIHLGQEILPDFIWDNNPELKVPHLYVTAKNSILRIRAAACEKFSTCDQCTQSMDPYCGWCILESRCSTKNECQTALYDNTRWLGPETSKCIYATSPEPRERTLNANIVMMVYLLPVLVAQNHHKYECMFNGEYTSAADLHRRSGGFTQVVCKAPPSQSLPPSPFGKDYVNVSLSVRYDRQVDVVSTVVQFYDCHLYGQSLMKYSPCAGCLSSQWNCVWCVSQHTCLPQEDASDLCTSNRTVCPTILGVAPSDKLIPVGQPRSIRLSAEHLPLVGTYRCELYIDGNAQASIVQATKSSENEVICDEHRYNYSRNSVTARSSISVVWKLNFIVDYQDWEPITFYKCSVGHSDCSRCVTADPMYKCGWCGVTNECTIMELCTNPSMWVTNSNMCPHHEIKSFSPYSGPLEGGTRVKIRGENMGTRVEDIQDIKVAGARCVVIPELYQVSVQVVCETVAQRNAMQGKVEVTLRNITMQSNQVFYYRNPVITDLVTTMGPQAGGTIISINGKQLNTGHNITVDVGSLPCMVRSIAPEWLNCSTSPSPRVVSNRVVTAHFDDLSVRLDTTFDYVDNPSMDKVSTLTPNKLTSFLAGGRDILFTGHNFNAVRTPTLIVTVNHHGINTKRKKRGFSSVIEKWRLKRSSRANQLPSFTDADYSTPCVVVNSTYMTCPTPLISKGQGSNTSTNVSDSLFIQAIPRLVMDNHVITFPPDKTLQYYPNPQFQPLNTPKEQRSNEYLKIKVYNLNKEAITKNEIIVMIGTQRCFVASWNEEDVLCTVPPREGGESSYEVKVTVGYIEEDLGKMSYYIDRNELSLDAKIGIGVSAAVVGIIVFVIIGLFARNSKMHKANKNDFQKAMENMEMSVRADFRKAFAELSIDMSDLTADIGDYGIPCLDYRTYVTNLFFPSYRYHPCMKQPDTDCDIPSNLKQGLSQFLSLLSNHNFLAGFIHTLEEQKSFSNRDKGNVASLLTVVLHQKLDYYTEIMKSLVSDLIAVNVQRNPKLILRRSDSVAERMLSNWMYICLYPYLRDIAGNNIFLLLKAIKQQVSKGPLDAITGKARYTLNDDRLLKEDIETDVLTLFVAPSNSSDDEPVIVKVLSCDTVTQVKEKVMDAVYKRVLFSQRPTAEQLDLEWRHGRQGHLVLPTHGHMMEQGSRWRRLMTIQDYKVGNNATLALIPKQQELNGSQDLSSIMSNHSADTSALSPMLPEETATKHYHLVKYSDELDAKRESTINRDRHKHIADLYLLRLINMKGILQNYVDAVMQSILDRNTVPCPVKYFFHFLDEIAAKHGITDPEVLHIWKTNSLLGRFWVTILKNPESVFDIEKPDTIASSMAVISQTFIDACSVTEHKPTKDSPINKQLYAKEIPTYKKMVQDYYKVIKEQNSVSDQDVNAYIAEISRKHPCEFDVNVALKELWGYVNKYYEEMNESLENDLNIPPAIMQRLQHTYSLIDIAVNGS